MTEAEMTTLVEAAQQAERLLHEAAVGQRLPVDAPSSRHLHDAAKRLRRAWKAVEADG